MIRFMKKFIYIVFLLYPFIALAERSFTEVDRRHDESDRRLALSSALDRDLKTHGGKWEWLVDSNTGCYVWNFIPLDDSTDDATIKWSGSCVDSQATGRGIVEYYVKGVLIERYEGNMKEGKREGKGVSYYTNSRYEGEWKDSKKHGKGILFSKDGTREEGEWKDDIMNGKASIKEDKKTTIKEYRKGYEVTDYRLKKEAEAALESEQKSKKEAEEIAELQRRNQRMQDEISNLRNNE